MWRFCISLVGFDEEAWGACELPFDPDVGRMVINAFVAYLTDRGRPSRELHVATEEWTRAYVQRYEAAA